MVRNTKRLGEALGVRVMVSAFQKVVTFSVYDDESGRVYSEVADIPPLPISFELNSELSALSWDACDLSLPLAEIRRRYDEIVARPRLDPIFTLILVGLANASFCRLFGGEWCAVGIVFTATLLDSTSSSGCRPRDSITMSSLSRRPSRLRCTLRWR